MDAPKEPQGTSGAKGCKYSVDVCAHAHTWTHVCCPMHLFRSSPSASSHFHLSSTFTSAGAESPTTCSLWCSSELESPAYGLLPEENARAFSAFDSKMSLVSFRFLVDTAWVTGTCFPSRVMCTLRRKVLPLRICPALNDTLSALSITSLELRSLMFRSTAVLLAQIPKVLERLRRPG